MLSLLRASLIVLALSVPPAHAAVCDINNDSSIDTIDLNLIAAARGTLAAVGDPRDADGDGRITVIDGRICALRCTRAGCATVGTGTPTANNDAYRAIGNVPITIPVGGVGGAKNLLADDTLAGGTLTGFGPVSGAETLPGNAGTSTSGGNVTVNANGSFTYNPPAGFRGNDTFRYTLTNANGVSTATVTITVSEMIWFVDSNAAPGGNGRLTAPFNCLVGVGCFSAAAAGAGDNIFVYSGNYRGGLTLLANQRLIGQGASASIALIAALTLPPGSAPLPATGGVRPAINAAVNNVTLGQNNFLRGLNLNNSVATSLVGNSFGNLTISEVSINATSGVAINLNIGNPTVSFTSVSASGGSNGIVLSNTTGSFTVNGDGATPGSGGTLQSLSADGVLLTDPGDVTLKFVNVTNTGKHGITLASTTGTQKLTLQNTAVQGAGVAVGTLGDGLNFSGTGSSNTTIAVNASSFKTNEQNGMFLITPLGSSATLALSVLGGTVFQNNAAAGLSVPLFGSGNATVDVQNNTFGPDTVGSGNAINVSAESTVATQLVQARIINNTINMFSGGAGNGLEIAARNVGTMKVDATGNTISNFSTIGIRMLALGTNTQIDATVKNNLVTAPTTTATIIPLEGILFASGPTGSSVTTSRMCLNISNNNSTGGTSVPSAGYRVRQRVGATFQLQGYFGLPNSPAAVGSFITTIQSNVGTVLVQPVGTNFQVNYTSAICATPSF